MPSSRKCVCMCARTHAHMYVNISATVHHFFCMGLLAVFWRHRLFSLVLLVRNAAFIRSTNPCLCQTDSQPESSRVAAENGWGVEETHKGNVYSLVHKTL